MEEGKDIELRSEEVQEVLGAVPPWILKWGITILSCIVFVLLVGSWFFKYPDTISSNMTLTGAIPAAGIVAKTNGKLMELNVKDKQVVKRGEYLAILENPASTNNMFALKKGLEQLIDSPDSIIQFPSGEVKLGSVQGIYSSFIRSLNNYRKFVELDYYPKKITSIKDRVARYEKYYQGMLRQKELTEEQFRLAGIQFNRDSLLNRKEVISNQDMDNARNQYLQSRLTLENIYSSLENQQIQITQLQETLLDTELQYLENKNTQETDLNTLGIQLMNEIKTWEMNYVLVAPVDGVITFVSYWSENQNVTAGETVFTIIPTNNEALMGKALLPAARSGKVKIGQKVNIHFLNYPDEEFGMVRGQVNNISLVPSADGNYVVEVGLPAGLMTTYRKELPFSQDMKATADIITEDLRLMERFFLPVKKIFKESVLP